MEAKVSKEDELLPDFEEDHNQKLATGSKAKPLKGKLIQKSFQGEDEEEEDSDSDLSDLEYECKVCSKRFSGFIPLQQHQKSGKHEKGILKKKREKQLKKKIINEAEDDLGENIDNFLFVKKPYGICQPCGKRFEDPEAYSRHLDSKYHKLKLTEKSFLDQVRENGKVSNELLANFIKEKAKMVKSEACDDDKSADLNKLEDFQKTNSTMKSEGEDSEEEDANYECETCEKVFSGFVPFAQHIISKLHAKTVKRKELISKLTRKFQDSGSFDSPSSSGTQDLSSLEVISDIIICSLCSMSFSGPENAMAHLKSKGHSKKLKAKMWKLSRKQNSASISSDSESEESFSSKGSLHSNKLLVIESDANNSKVTTKESKAEKPDPSKVYGTDDEMHSSKTEKNQLENVDEKFSTEAEKSIVVESENISAEKNKDSVSSYGNYKHYKEIMNKSDGALS